MRTVHTAIIAHDDDTVETAKVARVDDLRIPIHFCFGFFEAATQEEINDLICDLTHELERR